MQLLYSYKMDNIFINKRVKIEENKVWVNGQLVHQDDENTDFAGFAKALYKKLECKYRKFYKMDAMSKLGFLASEYLLSDTDQEELQPDEKSVILANSSASLQTDQQYQKTIADMPSPAVFVYTLPNIVIGEICIRHNIQGETTFFVDDELNNTFFYNYIAHIFQNTATRLCVAGWLEMSAKGKYLVDMWLITTKEGQEEFSENILKQLKIE